MVVHVEGGRAFRHVEVVVGEDGQVVLVDRFCYFGVLLILIVWADFIKWGLCFLVPFRQVESLLWATWAAAASFMSLMLSSAKLRAWMSSISASVMRDWQVFL